MGRERQSGYSLVELLVSLTVLLLFFTGLARMLIDNSRINRAVQADAELQAGARNCLSMVVQELRSSGWDPMNAGIPTVALDADPGDDVSQIEIFVDRDEDGATDGDGEQVLIQHQGRRLQWRRSSDTSQPFAILASNITNDADGDGTPEPMFEPDSATDPSRITVRITAESPVLNPVTGQPQRHTLRAEVVLRKNL